MKLLLRCALLVGFCSAPVICFGKNIVLSGAMSSSALQQEVSSTVVWDGLPDETFGCSGTEIPWSSPSGIITNAMIIQPDDKILVAGSYNNYMCLARFIPDGSLDKGFGTSSSGSLFPGIVQIPGRISGADTGSGDIAYAITLQDDGKILLAGQTFNQDNGVICIALARFLQNGVLDDSFGVTTTTTKTIIPGTVFVPTSLNGGGPDSHNIPQSIAVLSDGKIVISGDAFNSDTQNEPMFAARFLSNGTLDESFGVAGEHTRTLIPGTMFIYDSIAGRIAYTVDYVSSMAIQPDGRIVLGGYGYNNVDNYNIELARLMPDGTLDESFGATTVNTVSEFPGTVYLSRSIVPGGIWPTTHSLVLQNDGKIVICGEVTDSEDAGGIVIVSRWTDQGVLDDTFGISNVDSPFPGMISIPRSLSGGDTVSDKGIFVVLQNDKKIVVGCQTTNGTQYYAVARFLENGSPDLSFAKSSTTSLIPGTEYISILAPDSDDSDLLNATAIQSDGKIILGGNSNSAGCGLFIALVRLYSPLSQDQYRAVYTPAGAGLNC